MLHSSEVPYCTLTVINLTNSNESFPFLGYFFLFNPQASEPELVASLSEIELLSNAEGVSVIFGRVNYVVKCT